eukprot:403351513
MSHKVLSKRSSLLLLALKLALSFQKITNEEEWIMFHKRGKQSSNWNLSIQQFVLFRKQYQLQLKQSYYYVNKLISVLIRLVVKEICHHQFNFYQRNQIFQLENTTFDGFSYSEEIQIGSQIIRFDELSEVSNPSENSTFKNVTMRNCQVNFFLFGGFKDNGITNLNQLYVMYLINLNIVNNIISREQAIIKIDKFISTDNSQVVIQQEQPKTTEIQ